MSERLYRTQILLEPAQHRALAAIAEQDNRSLSDVVRRIIQRYLDEQAGQAELDALDDLGSQRRQIKERSGVYEINPTGEVQDATG